MMTAFRLLAAMLTVLASPGCIATGVVCSFGAQSRVVAELVFGRNIGDRLGVGEAEWRRFLDEEVTPRFPDGFTVLEGQGQWRDAARGALIREPSKILVVALPDGPEGRTRLAEIAAAYKARFRQEAVLTMTRASCVGF